MNSMPDRDFSAVSLFAGCGGSSLGYYMAGGRVLLAVEWDPRAAACYMANFPGTPFHLGDIAELSGGEAMRLAGLWEPGELDILDGSPPCQGFSTAGKRQAGDPRNGLFWEYVRLLGAFRPKAFVMENVSGLVKGRMRPAFREITAALKAAGYEVRCRLVDAKWLGVPQERKRLIWLGARSDLGLVPEHPKPFGRPISVAEALGGAVQAVVSNSSFRAVLRSPELASPTLTAGNRLANVGMANRQMARGRDAVETVTAAVARGMDRPAPALCAGRKPIMAESHSPQVIEAWRASRPGQSLQKARCYVGSFQSCRLDPAAPSPTAIAAHRHWHYAQPRYITIEEAKVLSSFPESFRIEKRDYRLIGNAVPPLMAKAIAEAVYDSVVLPARERIRAAQAAGSADMSDSQTLATLQPEAAS